jgi:hypothetical protein
MECGSVNGYIDCMTIFMHYLLASDLHASAANSGVIPVAAELIPLAKGADPLARGETYVARGGKSLSREVTPFAGDVRDGTRGALSLVREMAHPGRGAGPGTRGMTPPPGSLTTEVPIKSIRGRAGTPPAFFCMDLGALCVLVLPA